MMRSICSFLFSFFFGNFSLCVFVCITECEPDILYQLQCSGAGLAVLSCDCLE